MNRCEQVGEPKDERGKEWYERQSRCKLRRVATPATDRKRTMNEGKGTTRRKKHYISTRHDGHEVRHQA